MEHASASCIRRDCLKLVQAPKRQPLSKSASELLYVTQGGTMVPWCSEHIAYMREPMDCLKSRRYDGVIFVGPARTGKTVSLVDAWIVDTIVNDPADMLLVQISEEKAREYSKKRLGRSFHASHAVSSALSPRLHDNNVHDKLFKAGNYLKIGWPSKNIFASSDWKRVALTDYDRMVQNVGGEGSPWFLASKRTQTFMSSGMSLAEGSPSFDIVDPNYKPKTPHEAPPTKGILGLYNQGDRRLFFWQCPACKQWFEPTFELLTYDHQEPDPTRASLDVWMACPHCGTLHAESQKDALNQNGLWVPEGAYIDENKCITGHPKQSRIASFWQKGATAGFQTWNQLVYKYLCAQRDYEKTGSFESLKATINIDQGLPFTPPSERQPTHRLQQRGINLNRGTVPNWVRFLTASIDVQGGKHARFEVQVMGWGAHLECVVIDRFSLTHSQRLDAQGRTCAIDPASYLEDWHILTHEVLCKRYEMHVDGASRYMQIFRTACDSGGESGVTDHAYCYYRALKKQRLSQRFMLVKGASRLTAPIIKKSFPDNSKRSDRRASASGDVPVCLVNTNKVKDIVSNSLGRGIPGPRYVHFPNWLPETFFDELNSEHRGIDGKWKKASSFTRNESLDLMVYAWAILLECKADRIDWTRPPPWANECLSNSEVFEQSVQEQTELAVRRRRRRT